MDTLLNELAVLQSTYTSYQNKPTKQSALNFRKALMTVAKLCGTCRKEVLDRSKDKKVTKTPNSPVEDVDNGDLGDTEQCLEKTVLKRIRKNKKV